MAYKYFIDVDRSVAFMRDVEGLMMFDEGSAPVSAAQQQGNGVRMAPPVNGHGDVEMAS